MKRLAILSVSLLVFIFLAGCAKSGGTGTGVVIKSFIAYPDVSEPSAPVLLQLQVQNNGGAITNDVQAELLGLTDDWTIKPDRIQTIGDLYASDPSRGITQGAENVIEWMVTTPEGKSVDIPYDATAHTSYSYVSALEVLLRAVTTDYLKQTNDKGGIKFQSVTTGPISIKAIAPSTVIAYPNGKIPVQFSIENVGNGKVEGDKLVFTVKGMACSRSEVRLIQGKTASLYCTVNVGAISNYKNFPLSLSTSYRYWTEKTATVKVLKTVPIAPTVPVQPTVPEQPTQPPAIGCVHANPTVRISPKSQTAYKSGSTLTYSIIVTNYDSSDCGSSTFALTASCPSGWTCSFGKKYLTISPGSYLPTTTLTVTSPSTATGKNSFEVTAASGVYTDTEEGYFEIELADNTPPAIEEIISIGDDTDSPYETSNSLPDIVFTTNEIASCRVSLTDQSYDQMGGGKECSVTGAKNHICRADMSYEETAGKKTVYVACSDSSNNKKTYPIEFKLVSAYTGTTTPETSTTTIQLKAGLNTIKYTGPTQDIKEATKPITSVLVSIMYWDGEKWYSFAPAAPSNDLNELANGKTYYVKVTEDIAWKISAIILSTTPSGTTVADAKPTVSITAPLTATAGQSVAMIVRGDDDVDVERLYIGSGEASPDIWECTGSQTTCEHTFTYTYAFPGTYTMIFWAKDSAGQDSDSMTHKITITDGTPPEITVTSVGSDSSPPYQIYYSVPEIVFTTDENAWCRISGSEQSYDQMPNYYCVIGEGAKSHTCSGLTYGSSGTYTIYIACRDSLNNKHGIANNKEVSLQYTRQ